MISNFAVQRVVLTISCAALFCVGVFAQEKSVPPPHRVAIRAGHLIDGKSDAAVANAMIVIEGDKIVSVTAGGTPPTGVEVIDLSHSTVLPGLIDTHTHVLLQGDITAADYDAQLLKESIPYRAILGARNARIALEHGFTAMRGFRAANYPLEIRQPILMLAASNDAVVSTPAIEEFAYHLRAGSHLVIAGSKHEILQEQDRYRGQFWAAFDAFVPGTPLFG